MAGTKRVSKRESLASPATSPSKRAKKSDTTSHASFTPQPVLQRVKIPFGNPTPSQEVITSLSTPINGIPLFAFVNLKAAKLFNSVKNFEDFKIASSVFWLTFFANQRGCLPILRNALLNQLLSGLKNTFLAGNSEDLNSEWNRIYKKVLDMYISSVESFAKYWMEDTAAGVAFLADIKHRRDVTKETFYKLTPEDIGKLTLKGEIFQGLPITLSIMREFWRPLFTVVEKSTCYIEKEEGIWMDADAHVLMSDTPECSWYCRLRNVLLQVVTPVLHNMCEDKDRIRKMFSPSLIQSVLITASTPGPIAISPGTADDEIPPPQQLPIPDLTLSQWENELHRSSVYEEVILNSSMDPQEEDPFIDLNESPEDSVANEEIEEANMIEEDINKLLIDIATEQLTEEGLIEAQVGGSLSLKSVPLKDIGPLVGPFSTAMTERNIWGQMSLMIRRVRSRRQHYISLAAAASEAARRAEALLGELKAERDDLRLAEENFQQQLRGLEKMKAEQKAMRKEINHLKSKPGVSATARQTSVITMRSLSGPPENRLFSGRRPESRQQTPINSKFNYARIDDSSPEPPTDDGEDLENESGNPRPEVIEDKSTPHPPACVSSEPDIGGPSNEGSG